MSKSRSSTPTPNLTFTNTTPSPASTTSRTHTHDQDTSVQPSVQPSEDRPQPLASRPPHTHSFDSPTHTTVGHSSHLVRPAESSSSEPMAKRFRRESLESRGNIRSSPSSDSQDDMADNETDSGKTERAVPLPPTTAPVKKKRTRTLTTPHQSAVLHALLAQSRFPTTAMREEVGRSIGLSARKVQIWFQNQRQKARRPRSQSDNPTNRTPQYGPFPNAHHSASVGSFAFVTEPMGHPGMSQRSLHGEMGIYERQGEPTTYSGQSTSEAYNSPTEPGFRLLGPGMPGAELFITRPHSVHESSGPSSAPPTGTRFSTSYPYPDRGAYHSPPRMHPPPLARPSTSQPRGLRERDLSRTLPPLPLTRPVTSSSTSSRHMHSSAPHLYALTPPLNPLRSSSPESIFAHYPPPPSSVLPPPYSLQPQSQSNEPLFSSIHRPSSSAWSPPGSSSTGVVSSSPSAWRDYGTVDLTHHTESAERVPQSPGISPSTSRSGRYDPVRGVFIPYSPSPVAPSSPPPKDENNSDNEQV
ncbi:hypothetical protein BDQ12DRAFT_116601 [Crucibulum laeve]|uniref:Homeobox domain-containing protein n=1 Tax=Crucibulum laeve TaxID=68775 RepID=A0A5C3LZB6_9AGAR|nr:hypothetical protein BDQ12DRAFT_116601 [Crucibulum laeve]